MSNSIQAAPPPIKTAEEEIKKERGERLIRMRGMLHLTRNQFEKEYSISADTLKNWELGRNTGLTLQGGKRVIEAFKKAGIHCSIGWLLEGVGATPFILHSTLSNKGDPASNVAESEKSYAVLAPEMEFFCEQNPRAFCMQVVDDGMEPQYSVHDYVAGERHYDEEIRKTIGQYCIVETQMGEILLRRVRESLKTGCYSLQCINILTSAPIPLMYDVELASAAPVQLHRKMGRNK